MCHVRGVEAVFPQISTILVAPSPRVTALWCNANAALQIV